MYQVQDIVDPQIMGNEQSMHGLFTHLRENQPVAYLEHPDFEPFWVLTRHEDIKYVSQNNDRFINNPRTVILMREFENMLLEQFGTRSGLETLIHMDNPKHRKLRNVTREWFKPSPIARLTPMMEEIAREYVDKMQALGGECDFVKDIALLYPLRVIMSIIGVEPDEEPMMLKLTQELFGGQDPDQSRGEDMTDSLGVLTDFFTYFKQVVEDRKRNPTDDLATVLANAQVDGEPIGDLDQISYFIITATAGHDTTAATIGGMTANNSCGARSIRYGNMVHNVEAINAILADGTRPIYYGRTAFSRWVVPIDDETTTAFAWAIFSSDLAHSSVGDTAASSRASSAMRATADRSSRRSKVASCLMRLIIEPWLSHGCPPP